MTAIHFRAVIKDGIIHIPEEYLHHFKDGEIVESTIASKASDEVTTMSREEAWQDTLKLIERLRRDVKPAPVPKFNRDELYSHLDKYGKDSTD